VGAIAAAPALAAAPLARAGANAVTVSVAGNAQGTGDVTATHDGTSETKTGETDPQVPVPGQDFFSGGVAAQEATARADDGTGRSAACAGLAGDGGSIVNIGESKCLSPGDQITGSLASFDPGALIDTALAPLPSELTDPLAPLTDGVDDVNAAIADGLGDTQEQFGEMGLVSAVKVISGQCTAGPGGAQGSAHIVDGAIRVSGGGQDITLLDLPVNPPPNTHLVTDLSKVLTTVISALRTNLNNSLNGAGTDLNALLDPIQQEVVDNVVTQVEANLGPLEENVLDITLNKQDRPEAGAIRVSALDLQLVPAAQAQIDASLASVQIGNVVCGPSGRVAAAAPAAVDAPQALPTAVSAGLETAPGAHAPGDDSRNGIVLAAFAIMLAGGTAVVVFRWLRA
ncbi:MAG: hypothetical protein ABWY19_12450, partial [Marmoricola sp.]